MTGETPPRRTVKATETVFEIIEFLDADSLSGVTDIASALDLAPSTVHKHLTTLVAQEYVIKEDRQYRLGFRFYEQGQKVRRASPLAQIAEDPIEELANTTGEVVWVFVEEHGYAVHLLKAVGDHGVQTHGEPESGRSCITWRRGKRSSPISHRNASTRYSMVTPYQRRQRTL
ncbi:IclR family transcriptional regulator [Halomicroarcula sp. GCM10025710]